MALMNGLKNNHSLHTLDLGANKMGDGGCMVVCSALSEGAASNLQVSYPSSFSSVLFLSFLFCF